MPYWTTEKVHWANGFPNYLETRAAAQKNGLRAIYQLTAYIFKIQYHSLIFWP
jgi:hypothetical protein